MVMPPMNNAGFDRRRRRNAIAPNTVEARMCFVAVNEWRERFVTHESDSARLSPRRIPSCQSDLEEMRHVVIDSSEEEFSMNPTVELATRWQTFFQAGRFLVEQSVSSNAESAMAESQADVSSSHTDLSPKE